MLAYYSIKKFSQLTSTTRKTLRYYDEINLLRPKKKSIRGYRLYSTEDIARLQQITVLKFLGYTLNQIRTALAGAHADLKQSLRLQSRLLAEKTVASINAVWLLEQITTQLEQRHTMNWPMAAQIIGLLQLDKHDLRNWQKEYYTASEYNALAQITLRYPADFWQKYYGRWDALFKEVEAHLHTGPESETGQRLARQWLTLKNEIPVDPALQQKGWQAFQQNRVPQEGVFYNPRVIEYITKAIRALQL